MSVDSVKFIRPGPEWDRALEPFRRQQLADIYFDHRYVSLYENSDARAEAIIFEDAGRTLFFPYLKRRVPSAVGEFFDIETAYGYGGPLATTADSRFLAVAWRAIAEAAASARMIAGFIRFHPLLGTERFAAPPVVAISERSTVYLDLSLSPAEIWSRYARDNKEKIRKAEREGITVDRAQGIEALSTFARFYEARMIELRARRDYFFGEAYFREITNLGNDRYRVYFARRNGAIIGAVLILLGDRFAHYHLSASRRKYFRYGPNNALRHFAITDLLDGPWEKLHFGGGRTNKADDGLLAFKKRFSKQLARFCIGACVFDQDIYDRVCDDWTRANPDKVDEFGRFVLKYRY